MRGPRSEQIRPRLDRWDPRRSPYVGFVVVQLEVDLRSKHLQIGNQCVGFSDAGRVAVEITSVGLRVALYELDGIGIVVGRLCDNIGRGFLHHLCV